MTLENSTVIRAKIMGISVPQLDVLDRLKRLGVPNGLVRAALADIKAEKDIISWAQKTWGVSEEVALSILNGEKCPKCGAVDGRHIGGCANAPEMYKTPEGIPVRRTPRSYHGDADEDGP